MKTLVKSVLRVVVCIMVLVLILSGCKGGELIGGAGRTGAQALGAALDVWYDATRSTSGITAKYSTITDTTARMAKIEALITASSDKESLAAWESFKEIMATLPSDPTTWSEEQGNQYVTAQTNAYNTLAKATLALD